MVLSILVPTIENRRQQFAYIVGRLNHQIQALNLTDEVELLFLRDNGEESVGHKRNQLADRAEGTFIVFVDDDDDVSDDYVKRIYDSITKSPDIDCIGIRGIITFRGGHPCPLVLSINYPDYFSANHNYFRPPHHINPMRRTIVLKYRFLNVSRGEDAEWALRLKRNNALKTEAFIDSPIYFYKWRRWWPYQLLLDWSEPVRHMLGLREVNCLRVVRRFIRMTD